MTDEPTIPDHSASRHTCDDTPQLFTAIVSFSIVGPDGTKTHLTVESMPIAVEPGSNLENPHFKLTPVPEPETDDD